MNPAASDRVPRWAALVPAAARVRRRLKPDADALFAAAREVEARSRIGPVQTPSSIGDLSDARWLSPRGISFDREYKQGHVAISSSGINLADGRTVVHYPTGALAEACHAARRYREMTCSWNDAGPVEVAMQLVALAATGSVLSVDQPVTEQLAQELGAELAALCQVSPPIDGIDRDARLISTLRAAHARIARDSFPRPQVTVLLATRRAQYWSQILDQLALQRNVDLVIAAGVHGLAGGAHRLEQLLQERQLHGYAIDVDSSHSLGNVLNRLTDTADTEFVAKIDDDDWYGEDHLVDLVMGQRFSSASVVGKAAEFIGFEGRSWLVRRLARGRYGTSSLLAGGTLLLATQTLRDVGGFQDCSLGEDQQLLGDVGRAGGSTLRIHGHGYVLRRHGDSTWARPSWKFVRQADMLVAGSDLSRFGFGDQARAAVQPDSL